MATVVSIAVALAIGGSAALETATALAIGIQVKAAATTQPCDSQFHVAPTSGPVGDPSKVLGMAAISASDIWAVGITSYTHYFYGGLTAHWDGSKWTDVAAPGTPGIFNSVDLFAVAAVPGVANNVWTVGDSGNAPLAAQWNGAGWKVSTLPTVSGGVQLHGVAPISATNIWAVGYSFASPTRTLIEHYDGTGWSIVPSPDPSPTSLDRLLSVSATSAADIWAVGDSQEGTTSHTLVEHWNGSSWSIVASPNVGAGSNTLNAVGAISTSTAWAVGTSTDAAGFSETLTVRWDGSSWTVVPSPTVEPGQTTNYLLSVSVISPANVWAAGYIQNDKYAIGRAPFVHPLVEHWDGQSWRVVPAPDGLPPIPHTYWDTTFSSEFHAIAAPLAGNVWAAGTYTENQPYPNQAPLFENLCVPAPTVSGVMPLSGNATGGTTVNIVGRDFNFVTGVNFGTNPAASYTVISSRSITATTSAETAGSVHVTVTNYAGPSTTSLADLFLFVPPAVSWKQYSLPANNGTTWVPIDATALSLSFTPAVDSSAILNANADLWTANAGVNQDLGIFVSGGTYGSGQLVGWKESGGNAGTFSPNAAFLQTVAPVTAGTAYTVTLEWKANHATSGTIFAAAGAGPVFSPTRLTAQLVAASDPTFKTLVSNAQYALTGNDGNAWPRMDPGSLQLGFTPSTSGMALISANADLWTQNAGVNQDLGIWIVGGSFGPGSLVAWKESGGFAGTFSPNAAHVQAVVPLSATSAYGISIVWKANHATAGTIRAGAGLGPQFSPTRLTVQIFPGGTGLQDAWTNQQQYSKAGSTGSDWTPVDGTNLKLTVVTTSASLYILSGNADLWTANAGVNQDLGIVLSGGAFGISGTLVAWKESGGAATFSPNAAYVQTVVPLAATTTYTVTLVWKANHATTGTIYIGAGLGPFYSPTRLTAQATS